MSEIVDFWRFRRNIAETMGYMAKITNKYKVEYGDSLVPLYQFDLEWTRTAAVGVTWPLRMGPTYIVIASQAHAIERVVPSLVGHVGHVRDCVLGLLLDGTGYSVEWAPPTRDCSLHSADYFRRTAVSRFPSAFALTPNSIIWNWIKIIISLRVVR